MCDHFLLKEVLDVPILLEKMGLKNHVFHMFQPAVAIYLVHY
jgi:hypothetical protein